MKRLLVRWSDAAYQDLLEITDSIGSDSPEVARKLARQIVARIADLGRMPERGRIVPELLEQGISMYRQTLVPPYRVIYRVRSRAVSVEVIVDSRRNLADLLSQRLLR
ncbi:MAG: type II toxin-antitoxin system RelE/ParE family toxin [Acidobacteriia bacterium]|nr:type II toxin-antitoxin system RelE/ParE family toxin [Terriglobia bacterium]